MLGVTETGSGASVLMKTDVRVLTQNACEAAWGSRNILDQHICVLGEGFGTGSGSCNVCFTVPRTASFQNMANLYLPLFFLQMCLEGL